MRTARTAALLSAVALGFLILMFGKEVLIAGRFGVGSEIDLLNVAQVAPLVLFGILSVGIEAAVVPSFLNAKAEDVSKAFACARASLVLVVVAGCTVAALISCTVPRWVVSSGQLPNIGAAEAKRFGLLVLLLSVWMVGRLAFFFVRAIMVAEQRQVAAELARLCLPLSIIGALLVTDSSIDITIVAQGMAIGAVAQFLVVCALLPRGFFASRAMDWAGTGRLAGGMLAFMVGASLPGIAVAFDRTSLASMGIGNVSAFAYADRLSHLPTQALIVPLLGVMFPAMTLAVVRNSSQDILELRSEYLTLVLIACLPASIVMMLESDALVSIVFERGRFDRAATHMTAGFLYWYGAALPFLGLSYVMQRILQSHQAYGAFLLLGALALATKIGCNLVFVHWFGPTGIATAFVVMWALHAGVALWIHERICPGRGGWPLISDIGKVALACAGLWASWLLAKEVNRMTNFAMQDLPLSAASAAVGCIVYICILVAAKPQAVLSFASRREQPSRANESARS